MDMAGKMKKGGRTAMNLGIGRRRTRNIDDVINRSVRGSNTPQVRRVSNQSKVKQF